MTFKGKKKSITMKHGTQIIEAWSRIVEQNHKKVDDVMRDQTTEDPQDDLNFREEE